MDPLTHSLSGFVIGKTLTKTRNLIITFIICSVLPDIDLVTLLHSKEWFLHYHRGLTHGILFLFTIPIIPALILRKNSGFLKVYLAGFLAYGVHLLMDLTNQYGVKILSPIDWNSYSLSLSFIVDPYIVLPMFFSISLALKFKNQAKIFYILSIIFIFIYLGVKAYLKADAKEFLKERLEAHQYRVYPLPNDFLRWWFVAKFQDEYITGDVDLFSKRVYVDRKYKIKNDELIQKSRETESVKALLSFAKHPVCEVSREGDTFVVIWRELSYAFLPNERFSAKVWLKETQKGYRIVNSKLKI